MVVFFEQVEVYKSFHDFENHVFIRLFVSARFLEAICPRCGPDFMVSFD